MRQWPFNKENNNRNSKLYDDIVYLITETEKDFQIKIYMGVNYSYIFFFISGQSYSIKFSDIFLMSLKKTLEK